MGRKGIRQVHQFVDHLVAAGVAEITGNGLADLDKAREVATLIAHRICFQYARTEMYVPAVLELELTKRDQQIWDLYHADSPGARRCTTARISELAAQFALTERQIYSILTLQREREIAARQAQLPGFAPQDQ